MRKPQTAKYANIESLRAYDAKDFPFVDVRCPELEASDGEDSSDEKVAEECWFRLRSMTLGDRERIEQDLIVMGALEKGSDEYARMNGDLFPRVITMCMCDENGDLLLDESAIPWLKDKPAAMVIRLAKAGLKIAGLEQDAEEEIEREAGESDG